MKAKRIRIVSVLVCLAIVFTLTALTRTQIHGAASDTVLFYNDRAWTLSSRLPAEQVHSVCYVPISFFVQLPSVEVRMNESLGTFIITHGDLFLSFDTTTDFAANQDKERTYIKTAEYHNERYVPARTVCAYLDLGYEEMTSSVTGVTAVRITDGNQQSLLGELARTKYPSLFPIEPEKPPQDDDTTDKEDSTSTDTDRTPTLSERTIYITLEGVSGRYTSSILSVLARYGYKATFFLAADDIENNAALLSKICAGGHEIAFCLSAPTVDTEANEVAVLDEISRQNEALYRLIKKKSHIWRFSDAKPGAENAHKELASALFEKGYIMWDSTTVIPTNTSSSAAANTAIDAIWENPETTLCFKEDKNTANTLRLVLEFIRTNRTACDVRVASPAFYGEYTD